MIVVNDECISLIKSFEGLSLKPYHGEADRAGIFTIGYGIIKYPPFYLNGKYVSLSDSFITESQATEFLKYEVTEKSKNISPLLRKDLSPNQYTALISFAYNLGEGALEHSTLRTKVNQNPSDPSIRAEFMKWVMSNGKKVEGLVIRRQKEADIYFKS